MRRRKPSGFTLIELMIVVAIVAILAAIAYPAYTSQLVKSNRAAAQAQMMDVANRQQQYLLANRSYATKTDLTASGYTLPTEVSARYTWDIELNPSTSTVPAFTVTFTPTGTQATDGALTINSDGKKAPSGKW